MNVKRGVFFHGQPKMPQCVHKLRKEKNKRWLREL